MLAVDDVVMYCFRFQAVIALACFVAANLLKVCIEAVVPCQNKIILQNFRPEPPPSVDRPRIILFQHGTTSEIILKNFTLFQCFILTWNHV